MTARYKLSLESIKNQFQIFTHTHILLSAISIYSLGFFFLYFFPTVIYIKDFYLWLSYFKNVDLTSFTGSHMQHLCYYKLHKIREPQPYLFMTEFVQV